MTVKVKVQFVSEGLMATMTDSLREVNRRGWEAIWELLNADAGAEERVTAASLLLQALMPFKDVLHEGWESCGICGNAIAHPEDCVSDPEVGTLCADCGGEPRCRVCGCTDDHACEGGCYWVEEDLCSACVGKVAADDRKEV
jgi:hypothetical protein